jgi:polyphosphate kinase
MRVLKAPNFKHLLVSPFNSRSVFMRLLARETAKGPDGYVMLKANHLTDTKIKRKIREAADAGVKMDLIIRTTYALKPHDNIRAISILDRFLEHQRVYVFGKGADRCVFMSSADLMERNLDWRVEVAFPIHNPELQQQVVDVMNIQIADTLKARILDANQSNQYVSNPGDASEPRRTQYDTYAYYRDLFSQAVRSHESEVTGNMAPRLGVTHS